MRPKAVTVTCVYQEEGESVQRRVQRAFDLFLRKELEMPERAPCHPGK